MRLSGRNHPALAAGLFVAIVALAGCRGSSSAGAAGYNEATGSESKQKLGGGTVAVVGRYTDRREPISIGARFTNLDYANLSTAPLTLLKLQVPSPLDRQFPFVSVQLESQGGLVSQRYLHLRVGRPDGRTISVRISATAIAAQAKISGPISRPPALNGWYPRQYCSYSATPVSEHPTTTIIVTEFGLRSRALPSAC